MIQDLNVKIGPQFYRYGPGALDLIPELLEENFAARILVIHGTVSWEKAKPYLSRFRESDLDVFYEQYHGECSFAEGARLAEIIKENRIDFIVGIGGGKLCDLVLYVSSLTGTPFGTVPTLASNCAPWTPLAVMYKENGLAEGKTVHIRRQAAFMLTDPRLVIDSPVEYFVAGAADTLAKWYESDLILVQEQFKHEPMPQIARYSALMCRDKILNESGKAIADMRIGKVSEEFLHISEIIMATAGLVGGFGDKYARNTAAHSIHDALSAYFPELHTYLHGEKVAYGIFYQLALEKKWETIAQLFPFYQSLGLPRSLTEMGIYPIEEQKLKQVIAMINGKQKVHLLPVEVNERTLTTALIQLEEYIQTKEV